MAVRALVEGLRERMTMTSTPGGPVPSLPAIDTVVERLAARFPAIEVPRLRAAVDGAIADLAHARVHQFLPILVERTAATALRRDLDPFEEARR